MGTDEEWAEATEALRDAVESMDLELVMDEGGGAFYGPKIGVQSSDAIGRTWQMTTIQVDFQLPQRFDMQYAGADNDAAPAGHDPPRDVGDARAVLRRADRALRRGVPAVALARADPVRRGGRPSRRALRGARRQAPGRGLRAVRRRLEGVGRQEDPGVAADEGCRTRWCRRPGRSRPAPYTVRDRDGHRDTRVWRSTMSSTALLAEADSRALEQTDFGGRLSGSPLESLADGVHPFGPRNVASRRGGCVFCSIPEREAERVPRRPGRTAYIVLNKFPYNPGHLLVVPLRHVGDLEDAEPPRAPGGADAAPAIASARSADGSAARVQRGTEPGRGRRRGHPRACPLARRAALERRHQLHVGRGRDAGAARTPRRDRSPPRAEVRSHEHRDGGHRRASRRRPSRLRPGGRGAECSR